MTTPRHPFHPPAVGTSATSRAAASAIGPTARSLREKLLAAYIDAGPAGLTDTEAEARTGIVGNTLRPRRGELARTGLIVRTNRTRKTPAGRKAAVWTASTGGGV